VRGSRDFSESNSSWRMVCEASHPRDLALLLSGSTARVKTLSILIRMITSWTRQPAAQPASCTTCRANWDLVSMPSLRLEPRLWRECTRTLLERLTPGHRSLIWVRGQTVVPAVRQRPLTRGRVVSEIAFEQVLHRSVWHRGWGLHPRAVGHQAPHLEIDPLRQLPVRHIRRPANLSSLITKPHPPDRSSPIQSHGDPPFVWPCLGLVSRDTKYRRELWPSQ
jgi:hypothetical protein